MGNIKTVTVSFKEVLPSVANLRIAVDQSNKLYIISSKTEMLVGFSKEDFLYIYKDSIDNKFITQLLKDCSGYQKLVNKKHKPLVPVFIPPEQIRIILE